LLGKNHFSKRESRLTVSLRQEIHNIKPYHGKTKNITPRNTFHFEGTLTDQRRGSKVIMAALY
jgi:hypothetical protein